MPLFYALTLFVSAFLLFLVQPMVGKMMLPLMGGTPLVWNTCMVFFQAMLLGGYFYSHATTTYLDARRQTLVHGGLMLVAVLAMGVVAAVAGMPIHVSASLSPQGVAFPAPQMLLVLLLAVGLPFFTVATSAPLLQKWFAHTGHPAAKDPYFLYGASNLGSVLALLAYPVLFELQWEWGVGKQSWFWAASFLALFALCAGCAWTVWRSPAPVRFGETVFGGTASAATVPSPGWPRRLRWLLLAFVPSSLMLGVTTYIATDIASFPLLWVIPLGLYLLTFVVAFSRLPKWVYTTLTLVTPVVVLLLIFVMLSDIQINIFMKFGLHLLAFLMIALSCHCDLARTRPPAARLTEFYLIMSIGGVLGGLFNAVVAPAVFQEIHEYKIALFAACLALPALKDRKFTPLGCAYDFLAVAGVAALASVLATQVYRDPRWTWADYGPPAGWRKGVSGAAYWLSDEIFTVGGWVGRTWTVGADNLFKVIVYGIPALVCYVFVERPLRFGLCVGVLILAAHFGAPDRNVEFQARSPFGVLRVYERQYRDEDNEIVTYHELVHGTTVHGRQNIDPLTYDAISYYHETGPIGELFKYAPIAGANPELAVIGLGTGTMSCYCKENQHITFFEIDPLVKHIAENPKLFSFLKGCVERGGRYEIKMGDARVQMERLAPDVKYGIIVVDAFSSDSIPVHLLTRQALALYLARLDKGGLIALHISNRHLDLEPVVRKLAADAGVPIRACHDNLYTGENKNASNWVLLARADADFGDLRDLRYLEGPRGGEFVRAIPPSRRPALGMVAGALVRAASRDRWPLMTAEPTDPLWTDDFSNLLKIVEWR